MGSGLGSVPFNRIVGAVEELLRAAVNGGFEIATKTVALSEVEQAWPGDACNPRIVFTVGGRRPITDSEYPHDGRHAQTRRRPRRTPHAQTLDHAALAVAALAAAPALAQPAQWPDRPVKMIVPLGAGGPADLVGRYVAQQLGERFKQSFFIENRPGAAGIIGTAEAAKARAGRLHPAGGGVAAHQPGNPEHQQDLPADARLHRRVGGLLHRRRAGGASIGAGEQRQGIDRTRQVASPAPSPMPRPGRARTSIWAASCSS